MKECLEFGRAIEATLKILKTLPFRPLTNYTDEHYILYKTTVHGNKIMVHGGNYIYVSTKAREYTKLPQWLVDTMKGHEQVTYVIGPWVFVNGFENTQEGKYLQKIFPYYFKMTERTAKKVNEILTKYGWWVRIHKQYVDGINNSKWEASGDIR